MTYSYLFHRYYKLLVGLGFGLSLALLSGCTTPLELQSGMTLAQTNSQVASRQSTMIGGDAYLVFYKDGGFENVKIYQTNIQEQQFAQGMGVRSEVRGYFFFKNGVLMSQTEVDAWHARKNANEQRIAEAARQKAEAERQKQEAEERKRKAAADAEWERQRPQREAQAREERAREQARLNRICPMYYIARQTCATAPNYSNCMAIRIGNNFSEWDDRSCYNR